MTHAKVDVHHFFFRGPSLEEIYTISTVPDTHFFLKMKVQPDELYVAQQKIRSVQTLVAKESRRSEK